MNTFFNFQTKTTVNPLEKVEYFYNNPYMPDNHKLLKLADKMRSAKDDTVFTSITKDDLVVSLFPIEMLVKGDCFIKWTSLDSFTINGSIWCKIVGDDKNVVRVDTVRF